MKLAFLAPEFLPPVGGVGIYSVHLVKELSKQPDMDIHVFAPRRGKDYNVEEVVDYFGGRIRLHSICSAHDDFLYNMTFQYRVFRELPRYHRQYKYDLIHAANLVNMPDIYLKFRRLGVPSVTTVHTTIKGQVKGFLGAGSNVAALASSEKWSLAAYPYISLMESLYLRRTRYVVTVSKRFAEILRQEYGYQGVVEPIHNGIDLGLFDHDGVGDPYDRFPQFREKGPVVLYTGRLVARKGLGLFAEVAGRLLDTGAHFVVAGRGSDRLLIDMLHRCGIPRERYTYLGFVANDQLPCLYKLSSVLVLPSFYENLPISLLEAMAMKVPCIASNVGGVSELIQHGESGLLFEAGDIQALEQGIRMLLDDEGERRRLAEGGHSRVLREHSSARMAEKHRQFYERVLSGA